MDPNRPNVVLYPKDDRTEYGPPKPYDSRYEFRSQPIVPGQELFDQYHKDHAPLSSNLEDSSYFYIHISGQIESGQFSDCDCLMVKYSFVAGSEWERMNGEPSGCSQLSYKSRTASKKIVWNFPFNLLYRSTCPKGWPQITFSIVGPDFLGREIIKGYTTMHVPLQPGRHERVAKTFTPKSSSILVQFLGVLKGKLPELIDPPKTLAEPYGREVIRADSGGNVRVVFNIEQKNLETFGFSVKK